MGYTTLSSPAGHLTMPSLLPGFAQDEVGAAALPSSRDAIVFMGRLAHGKRSGSSTTSWSTSGSGGWPRTRR